MTAAEIQQRVDAWLAGRSAWLGQDDARWSLASQWQAVSRQFGADSPAALGVLLGLVRAALGVPSIDVLDRLRWAMARGFAYSEALVAALEAAP